MTICRAAENISFCAGRDRHGGPVAGNCHHWDARCHTDVRSSLASERPTRSRSTLTSARRGKYNAARSDRVWRRVRDVQCGVRDGARDGCDIAIAVGRAAQRCFDDILGTGPAATAGTAMRSRSPAMMDQSWSCFINLTNGTVDQLSGVPPAGALIWGAQLVLGSDALQYQHDSPGSRSQNECTKYVKYNTVEKAWDSGTLFGVRLGSTAACGDHRWGEIRTSASSSMSAATMTTISRCVMSLRRLATLALGDGSAIALHRSVQPDFRWFGRDGEIDGHAQDDEPCRWSCAEP